MFDSHEEKTVRDLEIGSWAWNYIFACLCNIREKTLFNITFKENYSPQVS